MADISTAAAKDFDPVMVDLHCDARWRRCSGGHRGNIHMGYVGPAAEKARCPRITLSRTRALCDYLTGKSLLILRNESQAHESKIFRLTRRANHL
jgi:hypothetical protein